MPKPADAHDFEDSLPLLAPPELEPGTWDLAARRLLAKMLGEFAYEEIIEPVPQPPGDLHALVLDDGATLAFRAVRGAYGSWRVHPDTIEIREHGAGGGAAADAGSLPFGDPLRFLVRARRLLALDGATLGHLIRELSATLAADARLGHTAVSAARLADLGYAELEGHQTGHPWLVLNKGRLGFSATDTARWAPE
ncbi:IucA/IucC family protein, partial [Streptomyces albidochromogenes]